MTIWLAGRGARAPCRCDCAGVGGLGEENRAGSVGNAAIMPFFYPGAACLVFLPFFSIL